MKLSEMKLIVTDRRSIEEGIVVKAAYIVVSITDPGTSRPRIPQTAGLRDVLYVQFHDAEPVGDAPLPEHVQMMTLTDATRIWQFIDRYRSRVGAIVCHCEQGMSRSPAVAAAVASEVGRDPDEIFSSYQPNQYVFRLMRRAIDAHRAKGVAP